MDQGRGARADEPILPPGGGVMSLLGAAVLIWAFVIGAAILMF